MCSAHVMHTPIRLTPIHHPMCPFLQNQTSNAHTAPPGCPILENRTTAPHVSCPTCPIRAKRTTTMLISRSTCLILEKRTSKQPKTLAGCPKRQNRTHRASRRLNFPTENGGSKDGSVVRKPTGLPPSSCRTAYIFLRKMAARHADLRLRGFWCKLVDCLRAWRNGRRAVFRWQ